MKDVHGQSRQGPPVRIFGLVWGQDYFGEVKIVDVNIRRLRLKIETEPPFITTVWEHRMGLRQKVGRTFGQAPHHKR